MGESKLIFENYKPRNRIKVVGRTIDLGRKSSTIFFRILMRKYYLSI